MRRKLKDIFNYWMRNLDKLTDEQIKKLYNRGKVRYYIPHTLIITTTNVILFHLYLKLLNLNLFELSGFDYLRFIFMIGVLVFLNKNILLPVIIGDWKNIERMHEEIEIGKSTDSKVLGK